MTRDVMVPHRPSDQNSDHVMDRIDFSMIETVNADWPLK